MPYQCSFPTPHRNNKKCDVVLETRNGFFVSKRAFYPSHFVFLSVDRPFFPRSFRVMNPILKTLQNNYSIKNKFALTPFTFFLHRVGGSATGETSNSSVHDGQEAKSACGQPQCCHENNRRGLRDKGTRWTAAYVRPV